MKILQRIEKGLIIFVVTLILCSILSFAICKSLKPKKIVISFDPSIDFEIREQIKKKFEKFDLLDPNYLYSEIKQFLPVIKAVSVNYQSSKVAYITIDVYKPFLFLRSSDKEFILSTNGLLVNQKLYKSVYKENLYNVCIDESKRFNFFDSSHFESLKSFLFSLPSEIFEQYDITWFDRNEILYKSKKFNKLSIVGNNEIINKPDYFAYANKIYESKSKEGVNGLKIDIRFKDSLICVSFRGGEL